MAAGSIKIVVVVVVIILTIITEGD